VLGFFSTRIEIDCVLARLLDTEMGTTMPFSAISGAVIWMSLLSADTPPPMAFTVSATVLVANAAPFQSAARASCGRTKPATTATARTAMPPLDLSACLR